MDLRWKLAGAELIQKEHGFTPCAVYRVEKRDLTEQVIRFKLLAFDSRDVPMIPLSHGG